MLDQPQFLGLIKNGPLVAIDLLIRKGDKYLIGLRTNEPAKGFWFVPGGRILKDETGSDAVKRISEREIGLTLELEKTKFVGVFEQLYLTNAFNVPNLTTHIVTLVYEIALPENAAVEHDEQHSEFFWMTREEILSDERVHKNTKSYFDPASSEIVLGLSNK
jgi:colanic acid biosynthesis protein WcaH